MVHAWLTFPSSAAAAAAAACRLQTLPRRSRRSIQRVRVHEPMANLAQSWVAAGEGVEAKEEEPESKLSHKCGLAAIPALAGN